MASGHLFPPPQFAGLVPRSADEMDTPWEVVELPKFDTPTDVGTPAPAAWQLAMEEWAALNVKDSVWHYTCRADPVPYGCRLFQFHQVIETGLGDYLHYKPRSGYSDQPLNQVDLVFRRVPTAMLLKWEVRAEKEEAFAMVFSAVSGSKLAEFRYERDYRITWKRFQEDIRIHMVQKGYISTARDFKLLTENDEVIAQNRLLFPPLRTMAHIEANERMHAKKKDATTPKKKPSAVNQIIEKPAVKHGMKKPAAVQKGMKKPAAVKQGMKKPASV